MTVIRPNDHTRRQRATEADLAARAEIARGAELIAELDGSSRRDIAEVWWAETRRRTS